jgi:hypothetical protein
MLGGFMLISSCKKITDTVPKDSITDLNYWAKPEDMKLFANTFYTTLAGPAHDTYIFYDQTSDNVVTTAQDPRLFNNIPVPASGGGWASGDWSNIRNLNYFLSHYQTVVGDKAEINHYVGEARFFRANEYFNKVKSFGEVPWINKELTTTDRDILFDARSPRKKTADSIIADLEFAAANLRSPAVVEKGRLHIYAALQMLSRVCLYEATYMKYRNISGWEPYMQKAADAAKRVMTEGGYSIIRAVAPYMFDQFPLYYRQQFIQEDLTTNKECVLPRIYIKDVIMHRTSGSGFGAGNGASKDFIESFLCVDGNPIALSPLYRGDDSVQMEMTNRDPRLRNMIDNKNIPFSLNGVTLVSYPVTPVAVNSVPTGYMVTKFRDPVPAQNEANQSTFDWYVFRYAEVLLNYAEAKAELGTITQADIDQSINLLRARVDEPGKFTMGRLNLNPPMDPLSMVNGSPRYGYAISSLLYEIRRERRIELAFEGFRWDDIVRWKAGKLIENPKTMLGIVVNDDVINRYKGFYAGANQFAGRSLQTITDWDGKTKTLLKAYTNSTRTWLDRLYLNPLPSDQLTLNPNLGQNAGW